LKKAIGDFQSRGGEWTSGCADRLVGWWWKLCKYEKLFFICNYALVDFYPVKITGVTGVMCEYLGMLAAVQAREFWMC